LRTAGKASHGAHAAASALLQLFEEKVAWISESVRGEAAEIIATLIETVTIYPEGAHGPEAEIVAVYRT
jgi:site-specific DNA recombinase